MSPTLSSSRARSTTIRRKRCSRSQTLRHPQCGSRSNVIGRTTSKTFRGRRSAWRWSGWAGDATFRRTACRNARAHANARGNRMWNATVVFALARSRPMVVLTRSSLATASTVPSSAFTPPFPSTRTSTQAERRCGRWWRRRPAPRAGTRMSSPANARLRADRVRRWRGRSMTMMGVRQGRLSAAPSTPGVGLRFAPRLHR
mmetsp:Transcript_20499/g.66567  ORF Transcript_20499/g.66567 Transcript_20499/m.66567 type:complete len:201 (-) Transcript_20499:238-840(-)